MHHLTKDFLKVTEEAAIQTWSWIGRGNAVGADQAVTASIRNNLNQINMQGVIVIGEGEIIKAPMLNIDEKVGKGYGSKLDIAVAPIDGASPTAEGRRNAITVIAAAPKGSLLHAPDMYMEKIIVAKDAKGVIDIDAPLIENLGAVAKVKGKRMEEMCVLIQDHPRHGGVIRMMRENGVRVELFKDRDIIKSLLPCVNPDKYDMLYNIGGSSEGVLSAVAIKCLGGEMQARLEIHNEEEYNCCLQMGLAHPKIALRHKHLVASEQGLFVATAITDIEFLKGIQIDSSYIKNQSLMIDNESGNLQIVKSLRQRDGSLLLKEVFTYRDLL